MGYYMAGGYYTVGGLGSFFKKATKVVGKAGAVAQQVSPIVTAFNPALGMGLSSFGTAAGRLSEFFPPSAAPAGMPMEGTPPLGRVYQQASVGSGIETYLGFNPAVELAGRQMIGGGPPGVNPYSPWAYRPRRTRRSRRRRRY